MRFTYLVTVEVEDDLGMREAYPKRDDERESLLKPQREEYLPTPPIRL
jgi:hypothetical protein